MTPASNAGSPLRASFPSAMGGRDESFLRIALDVGGSARLVAPPNPWVGCVVVGADGVVHAGATAAPGGPHAEIVALRQAGPAARGATLYVTLEPCAHHGRTPPCVDAIVAAGVRRVVVAMTDPDRRVRGTGIAALRAAGLEVTVGVLEADARRQLLPYVKHRCTGRPYVVLKLGATLDGRIAAPDGSSRWITGPAARQDAARLRGESGAILVGAGTVRADDPRLTVRGADGRDSAGNQPLRVVLGEVPPAARVEPALSLRGDLGAVLDGLGGRGVLQLLVEGGAHVAHDFHAAGLVDRYVLYLAAALAGGDDGLAMFAGPGAPSIERLWRGRIAGVERLDGDLRVDLEPADMPDWLADTGGTSETPTEEA